MATAPLNLANHPTHVVLDLGSRAAIERFQKYAWYYGFTTEFCRCNKSFVFVSSETETFVESCIVHYPTAPPCSTKVDVLETRDVTILFYFLPMEILGVTIELDPKGNKITCPVFRLCSFPAGYSTMGHVVLDLTSLAYQPMTKSRERSGHPRRHTCNFCHVRAAYPARTQDLQVDEDDRPLVHLDHTVVSETSD